MTSKQYDVYVSFTIPADSAPEALMRMDRILQEMEMHDQLPYWYVVDAEELLGPDEDYFTRINQGETAPLTNPN